MFSLTGATKFKYIPNYKDMRGGYDKLCGVIRSLGEEPEEGTAYVFTSKDQKLRRIQQREGRRGGGCMAHVHRDLQATEKGSS